MIVLQFNEKDRIPYFLKDRPEITDCTGIPGTTGYCSPEAEEALKVKLAHIPESGIHYIGNGNYHYASLFFLEKIKEPFDLIVFDHHTDMQESAFGPVLSCGSWVLFALERLEMLENVRVFGPPAEAVESLGAYDKERIAFFTENSADRFLSGTAKKPVYLSVDLDILAEKEYKTVWDQGGLSLKKLSEMVSAINSSCRVLGMDYCG
ncbi:MAG: arginase family protein [Eubacterium sp.]|nr:arginase family protein [Eubacterium sp.]